MLRTLIEQALRHRVFTLLGAVALVLYGSYTAQQAELDVFPDFVQPQVQVQTEAPGLSAEQVEGLVTTPLESALLGLSGEESVRSESSQGLSVITVVFADQTDLLVARQFVAERISQAAAQLPASAREPKLGPLTSATMDLLKLGLVSDKLDARELRALADWTVRPRLLAVAGVAKASVFGGEVRQLQIRVDPEQLRAFDLSIADVLTAARSAVATQGAGYVETAAQRIVIEAATLNVTAATLAAQVLRHAAGRTLRIGDVAEVVEGIQPKFGDALVQGRPGVLLTLSSQYGANTLTVTHGLEAALEELKPLLAREGVQLYPALHRPATFIETALGNLRRSLLTGLVLVALVLLAFMARPAIAAISLVAIPLSLLGAVLVLSFLDVALNTMTLGGLAIAIGEVVDDAVIGIESISRRLRQAAADGAASSTLRVILEASMEVRAPVLYATLITCLVFLPVALLTGIQGRFFAPLAIAYVAAVVCSLVVALTVTPVLAFVAARRQGFAGTDPWLQVRLRRIFDRLLAAISPRPVLPIAIAAVLLLAAVATLPFLSVAFLPDFKEGHFVAQVSAAPGTSLPEMRRIGASISKKLLGIAGIATVEQQIGRVEQGEDPWGPNLSEFHIELVRGSGIDDGAVQDRIRETLAGVPGIQSEVLTFLGDRIGETLTGETAAVVVKIYGPDLDSLDLLAQNAAAVLRTIPGATDIQINSTPTAPVLGVHLDPQRLAQRGFSATEVLESLQVIYQGAVVAQSYEGNRITDIAVTADDEIRRDPLRLGRLLLRSANGTLATLDEVATIRARAGRELVPHENGQRVQTVTCNVSGHPVARFTAEAQAALGKAVALPAGYLLSVGGEAEAAARGATQLFVNSGLTLVAILALLVTAFGAWRPAALVLLNLPFAMVGGVAALAISAWAGGGASAGVTMGSLVGFVTLVGVTMRNSILLVTRYLDAQRAGTWSIEAVCAATSERLVPIIMTASITFFALLPLALSPNVAGGEVEGPMALVIVGGLVSSTALNLLVLPWVAHRVLRPQGRGAGGAEGTSFPGRDGGS